MCKFSIRIFMICYSTGPDMCHGRQVLMRDARNNYAATPLFAMRYRLVDLLRHRKVIFSQGSQNVFYDM